MTQKEATVTHAQPDRNIDFGFTRIVAGRGAASLPVSLRGVLVTCLIGVLTVIVMLCSLMTGTYEMSLAEVVQGILGTGDPGSVLVVREWRAPRAALAALFGLSLGMSGAVFQSLTRNPLGSPDIIGFSAGSYSGALIVLLVTGGGYVAVALGALAGGIATALVVFLLAYRKGVSGFRLIIIGIGVSAMLSALNTYLMLKAAPGEQLTAAVWGSGSLNGLTIETLMPVLVVLGVLLVPTLALSPALRVLEMGDDAAGSLGSRPDTVRLVAIVVGVALTALVTASAGPIAFIALVAPQIARRLTRSSGVGTIAAGAVGAFLLVLSDFVAQRLFAPMQLPVGIVTVSVGGLYFVWLLVRETRRR